MAIFKCKMCGGTLNFTEGSTVAECECCGTKQTLPKLSDEKRANLYDRANHFRRNNDYDKALSIYEQILNEDKTDAEAYWSIVLCKYGIEYVEDPSTHKRIPTVNRTQFTSIFADEDYKAAIANADGYQRDLYEAEAKEIDKIQKGILAISGKESPYDVFICYKETDNGGRRTQDSVLAQDLYFGLKNEGFNVFFSRITLEDKLGSAYEPHIFAAIHSAKVMVVLGTKAEHFNAVWVKNEWSRYLALIKKGENKTLIPAYKDMDPYDLPNEFSHLQAQDMSKLGFMQDLLRGIKKIVEEDREKSGQVKETVVVSGKQDITPLLKRAFLFLEDGDFANADEYVEKVLDINPECAEAYIVKLLIDLRLRKPEQLTTCPSPIASNSNFNKSIRFASLEYRNVLQGYKNANIEYIAKAKEQARKEAIYEQALDRLSVAPDDIAYKKSIAELESIIDYKDSKEQIERIKNLLDAWYVTQEKERIYREEQAEKAKIYAEEQRLEKQRKLEQQKIVEQRTKAKKKKAMAIGIPSALVIVIIFVLTFTLFIPTTKYNRATELLNAGKYDEAIEIYENLNGFSDSETKLQIVKACKKINSENIEASINEILNAGATVSILYDVAEGTLENDENTLIYNYAKTVDFNGLKKCYKQNYEFDIWRVIECEITATKNSNNVNISLQAEWQLEQFAIQYTLNGGQFETSNPLSFDIDDETFTVNNPVRKGYTFAGWTGTNLNEPITSLRIEQGSFGDREYIANWTANQYIVTFNPNNGEMVDTTQEVEFDSTITLLTATRIGYDFDGWYNGSQKYNDGQWKHADNIILTAQWTPRNDTKYTVKHLLQNITDDNYSLDNSEDFTGTSDTLVSPSTKTYTGFTSPAIEEVNITADGSRVVEYYYTRNYYTVEMITNGGNEIQAITQKYQSELSLPNAERTGYTFGGWFSDVKLTKSILETITAQDIMVYAWWKEENKPSEFAYTGNNFITINAYIGTANTVRVPSYIGNIPVSVIAAASFGDKTNLISIIIPNTVEEIGNGAFKGCTTLKEITLPFIGASIENTNGSIGVLGYIFGYYVTQYAGIYKTSNNAGTSQYSGYAAIYCYYIPTSLRKVTITQQTKIPANAFMNCDLIEAIILPNETTSIGSNAFYDCTNLVKLNSNEAGVFNLPTALTIINEDAFRKCSNIKEVILGNNITQINNCAFADCTALIKFNSINENEMIIPSTVKTIGEEAFFGVEKITRLYIPENIVSIGKGAFNGFNALEAITLPFIGTSIENTNEIMSVFGYIFGYYVTQYAGTYKTSNNAGTSQYSGYAAIYCYYIPTSLREVTITKQTEIPANAFMNCDLIEEIVLPNGSISVGAKAFYNCSNLQTINTSNIISIGDSAFDGCGLLANQAGVIYIGEVLYKYLGTMPSGYILNIKEGTTSIQNEALANCIGLTEVIMPNSLLQIGSIAFKNCSSLTQLKVPNSVEYIGTNAFNGCTSLTTITLPFIGNELTSKSPFATIFGVIPNSLTRITLTGNIATISDNAFKDCAKLQQIVLPETVESVGSNAFSGCTSLISVNIPDKVTNIGEYAFNGCSALQEVSLPTGITEIADYCFKGCSSLKAITLPANTTKIGLNAFQGCSKLSEIIIPQKVENIGSYAFDGCSSLVVVTITNSALSSVGSYAFQNCTLLTEIYIPTTVTFIGEYAFNGCSTLAIKYAGVAIPSTWDYNWNANGGTIEFV